MIVLTEKATVGALGVDTVATITQAQALSLAKHGYSFVVRYLGGVTQEEVANIFFAELAIMLVGYSRGVGWLPTAALGSYDGASAVAHTKALQLPPGLTLWCDLEGMSGTAADTIEYAEAWGAQVAAAGYVPGVYVGAGIPLDAQQLYALNNIHAYWHSCSVVPDVGSCSYQMYQLNPPNIVFAKDAGVAALEVDIDVVQQDHSGRLPFWARPYPR